MDNYEIRIVKKGKFPFVYECAQLNDHAAIRRAQSLAEDGDILEVWRGLDCVYATERSGKPQAVVKAGRQPGRARSAGPG